MIYTDAQPLYAPELQKKFLGQLEAYFASKNLPESIAAIILDEKFISDNPSYYTYYPYLFSEAFNGPSTSELETLNLAGFLYYKAVMLIDEMVDKKDTGANFMGFLVSDICKEEAIKLLASLFPNNHNFWTLWNGRKFQYAKAYEMDKNAALIQSYEDFEKLADYKCAFGKVAIDALFSLAQDADQRTFGSLLEAHKFYYAAFQITDDITDFQEDLENGQFNIAFFELEKRLGTEALQNQAPGTLKKSLYLEGIIEDLYDKALEYLQKAKQCSEGFGLKDWEFEIQKLHNAIVRNQLNVAGFITVFEVKNSLAMSPVSEHMSLEEQRGKGLEFISEARKEQSGLWLDYFNDAGNSDLWTTGFVMSQSFWTSEARSRFEELNLPQKLKAARNADGLWGYNTRWISDADSSTFVLKALYNQGIDISPYLTAWLDYQKSDGGFSTYLNDDMVRISLNSDRIQEVQGWTQSHFCVSAAAYDLLSLVDYQGTALAQLRTYLIAALQEPETLHSYWWTSTIYAFNQLLKAAVRRDDYEMISWLLPQVWQLMDGGIVEKLIEKQNYWYQGQLLELLCLHEDFAKYQAAKKALVTALTSGQFIDGSWPASAAMRIPHPAVLRADHPEIKWILADRGTNCVLQDFHRVFTTVSCVAGLTAYGKMKN